MDQQPLGIKCRSTEEDEDLQDKNHLISEHFLSIFSEFQQESSYSNDCVLVGVYETF